MINPYTSNPEDIFIKKEEERDLEIILFKRRKKKRIENLLFRLSIKEIIKQNIEAQKPVAPCDVPVLTSFSNDNIDPFLKFENFSLATG